MGKRSHPEDYSAFEKACGQAAEALYALRRLESPRGRKLTAKAFAAEARVLARVDATRLRDVERALTTSRNGDAAMRFVRTMTKHYRSENFPQPYADTAKAMRAWGDEQAGQQLSEHRVTVAEALALAAKLATEGWPEEFGDCESSADHKQAAAKLRGQLDAACDAMRGSWGVSDIDFDTNGTTDSERARGLVKACFRCAPAVHPGMPDWPLKLAADRLAREEAMAEQRGAA